MSYMFTNLFKSDPTKDFPYELTDKTECVGELNYFYRCRGKRKNTNEEFTVFGVETKNVDPDISAAIKNCARRLKTLKHPSFLSYIDSLETDTLTYIVTESSIPLDEHLQRLKKVPESLRHHLISRGIHQIATGISFLNRDAKLKHDNLCLNSIYVNKCGDWKLFGLEYLRPIEEIRCTYKKLHGLERYNCPESRLTQKSPIWSTDCWGLACLIWEIFNGQIPSSGNSLTILKSPKLIPKSLHAAYAKLLSNNPCSPNDFLELSRQPDGFMNNKLNDFMLTLEQFQLKDATEKNRFFVQLSQNYLDDLPDYMLKYKVLPQLINMFEFGDAGSKILAPMLKIGKLLDEAEYQKEIIPCIVKLFASPDRATRVKLLMEIESIVSHLHANVINEKIFQHFAAGFMDTNSSVRENSLKAVVYLAPKLNYNNLNMELMKHFACLQAKDDQPGIRTNATVCLGKIAACLDPQIRKKILVAAFTRAFHDKFPPARIAGILALMATQQFYTAQEIGQRVLPAICTMTVDLDRQVRDAAFKAVEGFLQKLRNASDNPELLNLTSIETSRQENAPQQWASWAFSALSSKFYKPTPQSQQQTTPANIAKAEQSSTLEKVDNGGALQLNNKKQQESVKKEELENNDEQSFELNNEEPKENFESDDWNVDNDEEPWQSLEESFTSTKPTAPMKLNAPKPKVQQSSGWDLDDWTN